MKTALLTILLTAITTSAFAFEPYINDHYKDVERRNPYQTEICEKVGITSQTNNPGFDLGGAIIGGIIGNNIGAGNGAGAAGALLGGLAGGSSTTSTTRYVDDCRLVTKYTTTIENVYSHSTITFMYEGKVRTLRFGK